MPIAYVGIGSNLGDRHGHLEHAMRGIEALGTIVAGSPMYETAPVGGPDQGPFLNAVAALDTDLSPYALLHEVLGIERETGRVRRERWGPRTLDLDILWYDGKTIDEDGLTIPHPGIRDRRFVLAPLADVVPGLADSDGPYADALGQVADQTIQRISGPYDTQEQRWMVGIEAATALTGDGGTFQVDTPADWENPTGDMFGAFLSAVVLRAVGEVAVGHQPSSLTYRFVHGVPQGAQIEVVPVKVRGSGRSADYVVSLLVDGREMGRASVSTVTESRAVTIAPEMPGVVPLSRCTPVDELFAPVGRLTGASMRSWRPLERWDIPDLVDGTSGVFRAWSPNLTLGTEDRFLRAAAILMPIDALIWTSTMHQLGFLGSRRVVVTPTLEFSGRFPDLEHDPGWHLSEVHIEHMTDRSVSGTIRVWSEDGSYLSVGASHNLVISGENLLEIV